eukprot:SAG11_NODE_21533_length_423_cov_1.117284_1_plen_34_part_10
MLAIAVRTWPGIGDILELVRLLAGLCELDVVAPF